MYKYLNFFNKKGEYFNFEYLEASDRWIGRVDFDTVSTGLIEDYQIYIMEEVFNTNTQQYELSYPIVESSIYPGTGPTANLELETFFKIPYTESLFLYSFNLEEDENVLEKYQSLKYDFDYIPYSTGSSGIKEDMKEVSSININPIQINVGFSPTEENAYQKILFIKDITGHIIAEILIYGEGEEEDERLRDWLMALGVDLLPKDEGIFDYSDVNEINPNWTLMNQKRKEMLLEYSNIYPYLGSYKALINIIKFFGYQNLRMKEYWLNIDQDSPYVGKFKQIDISSVFTEEANFNNSGLIPSKIYKKTNKFGLFYDITAATSEFDDDGIPIVEEVFSFSPQEILIKIFALKKKLQNYFLPVNAKIVDIIGEAVYFAKYDTNVWVDQYRIDKINLGLKPNFEVLPSNEGYLQDLRPLRYFGCPVGQDLSIGGFTNQNTWLIGLSNNDINVGGFPVPLDTVQTYRFIFDIPFGSGPISIDTVIRRDPDTGQYIYKNYEVADKIITQIKTNSYLNSFFNIYQEGGTSGRIRFVEKESLGSTGTIYVNWFSNTAPYPAATIQYSIPSASGGTANEINVSPGYTFGPSGAPIDYFSDCFIGYFNNINSPVTALNDDEDIPIGFPIALNNKTFDITWDDADVTFNQLDLPGPTFSTLFSHFTVSQTIGGWLSPSTPIYLGQAEFPLSSYPSQFNYSWQNLGYYGYYEMQWIVSKEEDETPAFLFDSGKLSIEQGDNFPLVLPYIGKYKVEMYLWDGYNTKSFLINEDMIEVKMQDSDFIAWYQYRELDYNLDTRKYPVQMDVVIQPDPSGFSTLPPLLTWDQYTSTWDLPLHPNEEIGMADISFNSIDSTEFYQSIVNPIDNPLVDRYPYTFNLLTNIPKWDDLYHLWWDGIGTKITQWEIRGITGPTAYLFMNKENSVVDLSSVNVTYVNGPTGYTGATGITGATGNTGDVIISNANRRTYQYDGSTWNHIIDSIDSYELIGLTGTDKQNMIEVAKQLNQIMPNDGISHPHLTDFIYHFDEEYDSNYNLKPYIRAVSKNFDKGGRHKVKFQGATGDNKSYETVYFGYLGDIPTFFEIYKVESTGPTGSILINGMSTPYAIGSTNLIDLANELNGPTAQNIDGINNFEYNLVLGYSGASGPSSIVTPSETKIMAISKKFISPEEITIEYKNGIIGTAYGRSLIKNPSWDEIRILKYSEELPLCTVVNFTYDNSKMKGKKNPKWILTKEGDPDFADIYYNNKYFSYMFNKKGSYSLSLELEDTNGNRQIVTKKEIIKIK
jgi:hypothetical protein